MINVLVSMCNDPLLRMIKRNTNIKCYVTVKIALQGSNVTEFKSKVSLSPNLVDQMLCKFNRGI